MGNISNFDYSANQYQIRDKTQKNYLEFFGKSQDCVVCFVDIIDSTKLVTCIPESKLNIFYSTFLNSMADIVVEYDGKIVKSIGDALLFYFENSDDNYFRDTLRCGLHMIKKRYEINDILCEHGLPSINYRVSADFGKVMIGYSDVSVTEDIFGPVVNTCSKINSIVNTNGMAIGNNLHLLVKSLHDFQFKEIIQTLDVGLKNKYSVYDVKKN